jgi:hypothetical protein
MRKGFRFRWQSLLDRRQREMRSARKAYAEAASRIVDARAAALKAAEDAERAEKTAARSAGRLAWLRSNATQATSDWSGTVRDTELELLATRAEGARAVARAERTAKAMENTESAADNARLRAEIAFLKVRQLEVYREHLYREFRRECELSQTLELAEMGAIMYSLARLDDAERDGGSGEKESP